MSTMGDEMDIQKPLSVRGVDSLLAVESRSWIVKEFSADVPVFGVLGGSILPSLSASVAVRSKLKHEPWEL